MAKQQRNTQTESKQNANSKGNKSRQTRRKQPRKDSRDKRVNYDNTRESKFERDIRDKESYTEDKSNDVTWYARNPEMLRAAASYGFSQTTGQNVYGQNATSAANFKSVPGLMTVLWTPTIGGAGNYPIQQAKESMYSETVHANSRTKSYDSNDLMILVLAGANVFSFMANVIRMYGVMRLYDQRNQYFPQAFVSAMGFDFNDVQQNLSNVWFDMNEMIARTKQLWIPNTMPFMARWFWMNTNIYMDSQSIKGQYYMYNQRTYWQYTPDTFEDGGALVAATYTSNATTGTQTEFAPGTNQYKWSVWKEVFNNMINALIMDQDRGIIFGDILKAYGSDKLYMLNEVGVDYVVEPTYNPEVLSQFENLVCFGNRTTVVKQDLTTNTLVEAYATATPPSSTVGICGPQKSVLNFHQKEVPTPEQIMVATRMTAGTPVLVNQNKILVSSMNTSTGKYTVKNPDVGVYWTISSSGTEVANSILLWEYQYDASHPAIPTLQYIYIPQSIRNVGSASQGGIPESALCAWSAFDWAPWIYWVNEPSGTPVEGQTTELATKMLGDFDHYTILGKEDLAKLHLAAVYSEFGVPLM